MKHQKVEDGVITAVVGGTGSGKTWWLKENIKPFDRQIIWDIEGQYTEGTTPVYTKSELVRAIQKPNIKISYQPSTLEDFNYWARCAFTFAQIGADLGLKTCIVAEEIADVTSPAKAPQWWGMLLRRGRKYGAHIYGVTQRPPESDKTLFGLCGVIHCAALQRVDDRKYMAKELDIDVEQLKALDWVKLEFIHKDMKTKQIKKGSMK